MGGDSQELGDLKSGSPIYENGTISDFLISPNSLEIKSYSFWGEPFYVLPKKLKGLVLDK